MDRVASNSAVIPAYAAIPAVVLFALLLFYLVSQPGSRAARYLVSIIWLRYMMSAFPAVSLMEVGGLTLNAITSILVIGGSFFFIRRRNLRETAMIPLALLIAVVTFSAILNFRIVGGVETALRYLYFGMIALLFVDAAEDLGYSRLIGRLLPVFAIPLGFQFISIVLGRHKPTDLDGSISYIGGYGHEASFSIVLVTGMVLAALHPRMRSIYKVLLIGLFVAGVAFANYRTSIIAMAPLLGVVLFLSLRGQVVPAQRGISTIVAAIVVLAALAAVPNIAGNRYATIGDAMERGTDLIKPPNDFTRADRQVFTGRSLIWSRYYYGWKEATPRQQVFGLGPDSWRDAFPNYAHNTVIGALYDLGLVGAAAILLLWSWMIALCFKISAAIRSRLLAAHVSFIVLSQATMPFWQIEGAMLYGVICGSTIYFAHRRGSASSAEAPFPRQVRAVGT